MQTVKRHPVRKLPRIFESLVRMLPPAAIRDEVDYDRVQEMIDALTNLPMLTDGQEHYLDTLTLLMKAYEDKHEAIDADGVSPIQVLKFLMQQHEMSASDLGRLLGERSLGPKILNGDRELSKSHLRILSRHFRIPADVLL